MEQNLSSIKRYVFVIFSAGTILLSFGITYLPIPADGMPFLIVVVPAVVALVLAGVTGGRQSVAALFKKLFQWRVCFKWYVVAVGLGLVLCCFQHY